MPAFQSVSLTFSHFIHTSKNTWSFKTIMPYYTVHFHSLRMLEKLKAAQEMQSVAWHALLYTFYRASTFTGTINHIQLCDLLKQCAQVKLWPEQQLSRTLWYIKLPDTCQWSHPSQASSINHVRLDYGSVDSQSSHAEKKNPRYTCLYLLYYKKMSVQTSDEEIKMPSEASEVTVSCCLG